MTATARNPGGIEKWIQLAQSTGLDRESVIAETGILPAVRYAVNAYIDLVSKRSFPRSGGLVADRIVFARSDFAARRSFEAALSVALAAASRISTRGSRRRPKMRNSRWPG